MTLVVKVLGWLDFDLDDLEKDDLDELLSTARMGWCNIPNLIQSNPDPLRSTTITLTHMIT